MLKCPTIGFTVHFLRTSHIVPPMRIPLRRACRSALAVLFALFLTGVLLAQTIPETEQRLRQATTDQEKQALSYQLAKLLALSDPAQATLYAQQALQLSVQLQDKSKEAESAWLGADLAERAGRLSAAVLLYAQAKRPPCRQACQPAASRRRKSGSANYYRQTRQLQGRLSMGTGV